MSDYLAFLFARNSISFRFWGCVLPSVEQGIWNLHMYTYIHMYTIYELNLNKYCNFFGRAIHRFKELAKALNKPLFIAKTTVHTYIYPNKPEIQTTND